MRKRVYQPVKPAKVLADHILHDISLNVLTEKFAGNMEIEEELTALRDKLYL